MDEEVEEETKEEVEPTEEEWLQAIMFLTNTGQKCDDRRQITTANG